MLMIPWGWASDRLGRRPGLIFSLGGTTLAVSLFGFSKRIWQMIVFRCLAGVFAGTVVYVPVLLPFHPIGCEINLLLIHGGQNYPYYDHREQYEED